MKHNVNLFFILNIATILLLFIITTMGIASFDPTNSYEITNQYKEVITMWGSGIYKHDSFFKAPIFIGTDLTILLLVIPLFTITFLNYKKKPTVEHTIQSFSVLCVLLYYSSSLAFGVTYNSLHLLYILLFSICFYSSGLLFLRLTRTSTPCHYTITFGMKLFLLIAGASLFIAWLPDIITSLIHHRSLALIETYTTEITYVIDMGIISPLMILTYYQLKQNHFIGYILFRMLLKLCMIVGIILPVQSIFQIKSNIEIPIPALITKLSIFVILALFAWYNERRLMQSTTYTND